MGRNVDGTRRRLLVAGGALLTAGCTSVLPSDETAQTRLGSIAVENNTEQQHRVQLQLRRQDDSERRGFDVLYEGAITVEGKEWKVVEAEWDVEPAGYTLLYATENELNMNEIPGDFTQLLDVDDCNHIRVRFMEPEGLTVWVDGGPEGVDELPSCE